MKGKLILFMLALLALSYFLYNPTVGGTEKKIEVKGKIVTQDKQAVPNVTIKIQGSNVKVYSDANGNFEIQAKPSDSLILRDLESKYKTQVVAASQSTLNITLLPPTKEDTIRVDRAMSKIGL